MQGIRPERLTNRELLNYAHLTGYDKLTPDWVAELAKRVDRFENGDDDTHAQAMDDEYRRGYDDGYDAGHQDATDEYDTAE